MRYFALEGKAKPTMLVRLETDLSSPTEAITRDGYWRVLPTLYYDCVIDGRGYELTEAEAVAARWEHPLGAERAR
jgi:hypothetical protein